MDDTVRAFEATSLLCHRRRRQATPVRTALLLALSAGTRHNGTCDAWGAAVGGTTDTDAMDVHRTARMQRPGALPPRTGSVPRVRPGPADERGSSR